MGKRVKKALAAAAAAAATGDPTAVQYNTDLLNSYYAKEATKKHGLKKFGPKEVFSRAKNSVLNPKIAAKYVGDSARAGLKGSTADKRANLRGQFERVFKPFGNTAQNLTTADKMIRSGDPNVVARGRVLKAEADKSSLASGKRSLAVAAVVVGGYALGGTSASLPSATTLGKTVGAEGVRRLTAGNRKKEAATGGLADTSDGNGDGMDPMTRARYQDYMSDAAQKFFGGAGATTAGAGATSCGMTGDGEPWVFVVGMALVAASLIWRIYLARH